MTTEQIRAAFEREWRHGHESYSNRPFVGTDIDKDSEAAAVEFPVLYEVVSARAFVVRPALDWQSVDLVDGSDGNFAVTLDANGLLALAKDIANLAALLVAK